MAEWIIERVHLNEHLNIERYFSELIFLSQNHETLRDKINKKINYLIMDKINTTMFQNINENSCKELKERHEAYLKFKNTFFMSDQ